VPKVPKRGGWDSPHCGGLRPEEDVTADAIRCKHGHAQIAPVGPTHQGVCPFCKEDIKVDAIRCKHCHADPPARSQGQRGWVLWELWRRAAPPPDQANQEDCPRHCLPRQSPTERGMSWMPAHGYRRLRHVVPRKLRRDDVHAVALRTDDRARDPGTGRGRISVLTSHEFAIQVTQNSLPSGSVITMH
jgi:hypothetical protein